MKVITLIALLGLLAGCASQKMSADHGHSIAHNTQAQTVNPAAATEGGTATGMEGMSADDAVREYKSADNRNRGERLVQDLVD